MTNITPAGIPMVKCSQCFEFFEPEPQDWERFGDGINGSPVEWTCPDCVASDDYAVESYTTDPDDYDCPVCEDHCYLPDGDPCPLCNTEDAGKK